VVQSPPLVLSFISVFILSLKNKKIILNISDLWPLAALELKVLNEHSLSHKFSLFLERFIYKKAALILGQSNEIVTHVNRLIEGKRCFLYRNFPDHKVKEMELKTSKEQPVKLFYAGLLGIAQGVYEMCEKIDLDGLNAELHLFGDGAEKSQIEALISSRKDKKIVFHGMVERKELHLLLQSFDVAIVPLKTRIYGSVPSKIFEYASLGFPILYFGGGEGETIVKENHLGWVASVENYSEFNQLIKVISSTPKEEFDALKNQIFKQSQLHFDLENQMNQLIEEKVF
jgi:hypothetical protein